ncbi:hypothetical protein MmazTMA_21500 [Methanosarcina mazei]|nr:hypothetical protein MmazTMA_21500 [Methanosarcina mazei]
MPAANENSETNAKPIEAKNLLSNFLLESIRYTAEMNARICKDCSVLMPKRKLLIWNRLKKNHAMGTNFNNDSFVTPWSFLYMENNIKKEIQ